MEKQQQTKPLTNMEISSFCSQIAMILESGISGLEGITIMLEEAESPQDKAILESILGAYQETGNFSKALGAPGIFPPYFLHMADIGEQTGKLDDVMASLSEHYSREDNIAKTIRNAVTYPLIMITMMVLVILVLIIKVMPIFNQVFIQLGREMTGFSRGIMNMGTTISRYSLVFILLIAVLIALLLYLTRTRRGKAAFQKLCYHFRFARSLYEGTAACRFASGMALTLSSGLNPDQGLELVSALIDNPFFKKKVEDCRAKTGSMDSVMDKIAGLYEEEIDTKLNNLLSILEPTLVIALSLIVGVILLSVMLPLMGIMSSL
ncbi:type II secretion system F family protein [Hespellia stercorisuis]|uniref:Type II secretion system protein F (GspF) n=1 Tax=Hespellia stercorisuis DSM 15480 TaxID=1121950 RepID=A0A1M6SKB3_9FIRM|nr:type II secretion system F family protein [Hespellia stercorisuis]SHK45181.1 type II secretion system protein F (GspF) [Hespellia stercorisuis DSM 15480]